MNQNLVQINDNYGAVCDENGSIKVISKEKNDCELKDILIRENELENLSLKLNTAKKELSSNKIDTIFGEILNTVIVAGEIVLYVGLNSTLPTATLITVMALFYIPTKGMNLVSEGSRIGRYIKRKKLNATIRDLDEKIPQLEKTLTDMKAKTKYNVECATINESKSASHISNAYRDLSVYMQSYVNEEPKEVKVLSLTRK